MKHLKEEFDKLSIKDIIIYSLAVAAMGAGFTLLFMGMLTAPEGEIHDSVLTAFGIVCLFAGSCLGIVAAGESKYLKLKSAIPAMIAEALRDKEQEGGAA